MSKFFTFTQATHLEIVLLGDLSILKKNPMVLLELWLPVYALAFLYRGGLAMVVESGDHERPGGSI